MFTQVRRLSLLFAIFMICAAAGSGGTRSITQSAAAPQNPQPAATQASDKPHEQAVQEANDASTAALRGKIKGREDEPASKVFKNVKFLADVPANRLLAIMNFGYSRALGVKCDYCHDESDYSSDTKRPKRAAREMQVLHHEANEQLQKMQNLQPKPEGGHFINCTTCHRGMIDPTKPLPK